LASTSAHKRSSILAPAPRALALVLALSAALIAGRATLPGGALAANAGGTSAPAAQVPSGSAGGSPAGGSGGKGAPATRKTSTSGHGPPAKGRRAPRAPSVRITSVSCTPYAQCTANPHQVSQRGTLLVAGVGLTAGMAVAFPSSPGARISRRSPQARLRATPAGLLVTVPTSAHSGRVMVLLGHGRDTPPYGPITVFAHALHPPDPKPPPAPSAPASASAFEGQGMWIWYISKSDGGNIASIIAQAHAAGLGTLYIKSSDGTSFWSQFTPQLVAELHAAGLRVCAWQYVYGSEPTGEAAMGAEAVRDGADCLVIDAEAEYEGHYAAAQTYIDELRAKVGASYPLGLASFPYVFYHPNFPYSVFLGPGGAQFNVPQMYWNDIGTSVDTVYANTYIANRIYSRPVFPLGQTFGHLTPQELLRFREEAVDYGASGLSFWDWQETSAAGWAALAQPLAPLSTVIPNTSYPELSSGNKGDPVLWMQEHLASAIPAQETTGIFSAQTLANVESFQLAHAITPSGVVEAATWQALLALPPVPVLWTGATTPKN